MLLVDVFVTAFRQIRSNALRSFFTLLGIIVSVTFLVAVNAIIHGMNAYVKENVANVMIGSNSFQVRRTPLNIARFTDDQYQKIGRRPKITKADAEVVQSTVPEAVAVSLQSGWPTPQADVTWRDRTVGDVLIFGVTAPYQVVQDYRIGRGRPLTDVDVAERRPVVVIGNELADKLFESVDPIGKEVRIVGERFTVIGVNQAKGRVLGQSFDGFGLIPITRFEMIFGRRSTTTVSVKVAEAEQVAPTMARVEEALRVARRLRPREENNFELETSDALVDFWKTLTALLFAVVPAIVGIGIVVGGIVIMNIMLMAVTERTHEIGIRKAVGARARDIERQFLVESIALATCGGIVGVAIGASLAFLIASTTPLPAQVTTWSVTLALTLGATVGVLFGVYPARRAARLNPIAALRAD